MNPRTRPLVLLAVAATLSPACDPDSPGLAEAVDPSTAPRVAIDRFSDEAATLFRRSSLDGLPGPDEPIDFDAQFRLDGLGPDGAPISYYNLDVQFGRVMPVHRVVAADGVPVPDQLPLVEAIPGQEGYYDFWQWVDHQAPPDYVPNSITSAQALLDRGWPQTVARSALNRPIVPAGSTAEQRVPSSDEGDALAWFQDGVVSFLSFAEAPVSLHGEFVAYSLIYVCFETPPGGSEPAMFCAQADGRTHNVLETLPGDALYSPLWDVRAYDPEAFDDVTDLATAAAATPVADLPMVNCPIARPQ
ncbi:MAG: hypothetical protein AAF721_22950 [Myxococcota bacterium]